MVKPALAYLDVIAAVRAPVEVPVCRLPGERRVRDGARRPPSGAGSTADAVALEQLLLDQAGRRRLHPHLLRRRDRRGSLGRLSRRPAA